MDLEEYLEKSHILGERCPNCNGFLFTEVVRKDPLRVIERCLKCGDMKDITDQVKKVIFEDRSASLNRMVVSIPMDDPVLKYARTSEFDHRKKEKDFLFQYEKRLLGE